MPTDLASRLSAALTSRGYYSEEHTLGQPRGFRWQAIAARVAYLYPTDPVHPNVIRRIVAQSADPHFSTLQRICHALAIPLSELDPQEPQEPAMEPPTNHQAIVYYRLNRICHEKHGSLCFILEKIPTGATRVQFEDGSTSSVPSTSLVRIEEWSTPAPDLCARKRAGSAGESR